MSWKIEIRRQVLSYQKTESTTCQMKSTQEPVQKMLFRTQFSVNGKPSDCSGVGAHLRFKCNRRHLARYAIPASRLLAGRACRHGAYREKALASPSCQTRQPNSTRPQVLHVGTCEWLFSHGTTMGTSHATPLTPISTTARVVWGRPTTRRLTLPFQTASTLCGPRLEVATLFRRIGCKRPQRPWCTREAPLWDALRPSVAAATPGSASTSPWATMAMTICSTSPWDRAPSTRRGREADKVRNLLRRRIDEGSKMRLQRDRTHRATRIDRPGALPARPPLSRPIPSSCGLQGRLG
mmetsp:Transcript_3038/g.7119  ORF Transcript_3038/g.7119 Transcript_3038/m.7119 type:complete len:295 (+) Transcript_3038:1055-1939(+)